MGTYFNPRNKKFEEYTKRKIFVDKTGFIGYLNRFMTDIGKYMCVSRPRRFGKSYTADMLTAYYSRGCDSHALFEGLEIANDSSFEEHLNKYNVVYFDVAQIIKTDVDAECGIENLTSELAEQIEEQYPHIAFKKKDPISMFEKIYDETDVGFVFIIDEWDCPFRERKDDVDSQDLYLQFLKDMFKNRDYISFVYMTGILPIKKYSTGSALNMFREYTMTDPGPVNKYIGFTAEEVEKLAVGSGVSFEDLKYWYDGYNLGGADIYNSNSVYWALTDKKLQGYWTATESFEDLMGYVRQNRFGIHKVLLDLVNDEKQSINFKTYKNDLTTIHNLYDILAILVHLGYLAFDRKETESEVDGEKTEDEKKRALPSGDTSDAERIKEKIDSDGTVRIPNHEIYEEFLTVLANLGSFEANKFGDMSAEIVSLTFKKNASDKDLEKIAENIERIHGEYVSDDWNYDDEHELSTTVRLAYFNVIEDYYSRTEASSGHGRADIVFTPRNGKACLPMVMEFKVDDTAENALKQIKDKKYYKAFYEYKGDVILLGIVYDSNTQKHVVKKEVISVDNTKFL